MATDTNYPADQREGVPSFDRSPLEHRTYTPPVSGRYRKLPMMEDDAAKARHCSRTDGHVLTVRGRDIICRLCPVVWHDEGF